MTASFSDDLLQAMGFLELLEAGDISVPFVSITVYEARGVALALATVEVSTGIVAGVAYRLAVGTSVNEACTALNADVFTDNEEVWRKEKKSGGPFVLIQLGPTDEFQCSNGRARTEQDGSVTTPDRFVWCASCNWPTLDESDLVQFKAIKGARDDIAHASASEPPLGFARQVERLAHKVLWGKNRGGAAMLAGNH